MSEIKANPEMWRDCRKWHPKTIKVCFGDLRRIYFNASQNNASKVKWVLTSECAAGGRARIKKVNLKKKKKGTTLVSIIAISHYQVHVFFKNVPLERDRITSTVSLSFFGRAAAADEVKTFSNPIWKSTALITRLNFQFSHRYAHKQSGARNAKWGRGTKQSHSNKKHKDKRERELLLWGLTRMATIQKLFYKEEKQLNALSCLAQTKMVIALTLCGCCVISSCWRMAP